MLQKISFAEHRRLNRALAVAALIIGAVFAPNLATAAHAASTGTGTWRYYGTGSSPLTSAWHCGPTDSVGAPQYLSMQACVIKQGSSAQVAMIVNARAANNPSVTESKMLEGSSRAIMWDCKAKTFALGLSVCFGGTITYSGTVNNSSYLANVTTNPHLLLSSIATA